MPFTSNEFLLYFLPATLMAYFAVQCLGFNRTNVLLLLGASLIFYAYWKIAFLAVLLGSVFMNYLFGAWIAGLPNRKNFLLGLAIACNLALLGYFKYIDFFIDNANSMLGTNLSDQHVVLPLGISFFTFTQIAYLADCAKGGRGDHGPLEYGLFVTFFPHLIAGPIIHHGEVIPQFRRAARADAADVTIGLAIAVMGMAKKVLVADQLAPMANAVFDASDRGTAVAGYDAWVGALAYTLQIYFDFSGYSDMAVGLARVFGIRFPWNFNSPYKSRSIIEFWRRWHISLSRWLRNYLYIPLGGNRRGRARRYSNLLITMLLGGLWHGAHWNFVIWGGMHGVALALAHMNTGPSRRPHRPVLAAATDIIGWASTFVFVVSTWVWFRAQTTAGAVRLLESMFTMRPPDGSPLNEARDIPSLTVLAIGLSLAVFFPNSTELSRAIEDRTSTSVIVGGMIGVLAFLLIISRNALDVSPFIYFNF